MISFFTPLCEQRTSIDSAHFFINVIRTVASDSVDLACGQFSTVEACRKLVPNIMATFDKQQIHNNYTHSFLPPLVEVFKLLDSKTSDGESS